MLSVPKFGTLIAWLEHGSPRLGVVHLPVTQETLYAEVAMSCWHVRGNVIPTQVQVNENIRYLKDATVSLSVVDCGKFRNGISKHKILLGGLMCNAGCIEFVGDCVQYMFVASGNVHVVIDAVVQPWDHAAIIPCICEAGGAVCILQGEYENVIFGGTLLSSWHLRLHEESLGMITGRNVQ